jgi:hypothetical protein
MSLTSYRAAPPRDQGRMHEQREQNWNWTESFLGFSIRLPTPANRRQHDEGEKAVDVSSLRANTGYITLDDGYGNTGSCVSKITFIDGDKGILRYRGIPIEELAEKSTFIETAYLIIYGTLPNHAATPAVFGFAHGAYQFLHEDMKYHFEGFPRARIQWRSSRR